jgi:hypothetical protein
MNDRRERRDKGKRKSEVRESEGVGFKKESKVRMRYIRGGLI